MGGLIFISNPGYDMEGDPYLLFNVRIIFLRVTYIRENMEKKNQKVTRTPTATCHRSYSRSPSLKA